MVQSKNSVTARLPNYGVISHRQVWLSDLKVSGLIFFCRYPIQRLRDSKLRENITVAVTNNPLKKFYEVASVDVRLLCLSF